MSNTLPAPPATFTGLSSPCAADEGGCSLRTRKDRSTDEIGECRYCGWFACPHCAAPVCAAGDTCAACAAPMTPVEALGWAVTAALGGADGADDEEETLTELTLTDAELLALKEAA
jgi:hypothetical protein